MYKWFEVIVVIVAAIGFCYAIEGQHILYGQNAWGDYVFIYRP